MRSAVAVLAFAASAVMATPSPPAGTVLMPYSLEGEWASDMTTENVPGDAFSGCYTTFNANQTAAVWEQVCQTQVSRQEVVTGSIELISPSVVACGQNQQLGHSYGVFGGYLSTPDAENNTRKTPACVYFSRVDADHLTNSENAQVEMLAYTPEPCPTAMAGQVCCQATVPTDFQGPQLIFRLDGSFLCASGVCLDVTLSSYCSSNSNAVLTSIGIGMSVGGIALLLVTLAFILIIQKVVQG